MSIVAKPFTFSPNTTASSSQVNSNFDTLYNDYNGSIAAANLATDAVTTAKIADSNVTTAKLADAAVTNTKLSTSAITLGYAEATANQTFSTTTDLTNLSVTVTVPSGGRRCKITGWIGSITETAAGNNAVTLSIRESSTTLSSGRTNIVASTAQGPFCVIYSAALTAGSHTYKLTGSVDVASNVRADMSATSPGFILVEAI